MDSLYNVFVLLHFVGWAIVLGGYVASARTPGLYRGVFHGAATTLVSGVVMMGLIESGTAGPEGVDRTKLTVKVVVAFVIAILAFVARRQGRKADNGTGAVAPGVKHAVGALVVVNTAIAVFW